MIRSAAVARFAFPWALAAALSLAAAAAAAPAGGEKPAGAGDSGTITVFLPQPPQPAAPAARRRPAPRRGESPLAVAIAAALAAAAGLAWLGFRSPACPRCRQPLVHLERAGKASAAASPRDELLASGRERRDPWACLGCGIALRRRFGPLTAADDACPSCGSRTKRTRLAVVDRPGYLTWGEVRLDEDCLTCSHRTSALYAAPPLEAPRAQNGRAAAGASRGGRSSRSAR